MPAKGTGIPTNHPWLVYQATAKQGRRALLTWSGWWSSRQHHTTARLPRADQSMHPRRCIPYGAAICQNTCIVGTNLKPSSGPAVPQPLANSNASSLPLPSWGTRRGGVEMDDPPDTQSTMSWTPLGSVVSAELHMTSWGQVVLLPWWWWWIALARGENRIKMNFIYLSVVYIKPNKQRYLMPEGINARVSRYYICWHSITIVCYTFGQQLEICN